METIKNYLDNMFTNLPKTKELLDLKTNILSNMEDKYNELKADGKSENEAIGIVISEFGNIDELIEELGINLNTVQDGLPAVSRDEVEKYLLIKKNTAPLIGIGVMLCILSVASLLWIYQLVKEGHLTSLIRVDGDDITGLLSLFVIVAIAVSLFIYSGMKLAKYESFEKGILLDIQTRQMLQQKIEQSQGTYTLSVIGGVVLCILSPIALFIGSAIFDEDSAYPLIPFFIILSLAVYIFVYFGIIQTSYTGLLEQATKKVQLEEGSQVIGVFSSVVFMLATGIFLISGFCYNIWATAWIVYPIAGLLVGIFSVIINYVYDRKEPTN